MAVRILMPFGMVGQMNLRMCSVDGVLITSCEGAILGVDMGRPIVTSEDFVVLLCMNA